MGEIRGGIIGETNLVGLVRDGTLNGAGDNGWINGDGIPGDNG